jgi:hypothetical protein
MRHSLYREDLPTVAVWDVKPGSAETVRVRCAELEAEIRVVPGRFPRFLCPTCGARCRRLWPYLGVWRCVACFPKNAVPYRSASGCKDMRSAILKLEARLAEDPAGRRHVLRRRPALERRLRRLLIHESQKKRRNPCPGWSR